MTARAIVTQALEKLTAPLSMVCAGCDGPMVLRKNAVGVESYRCPKCSPFAPDRRPHPDDAMLPQGLVKANGAPPRVVRQVVRVEVPVPAIATRIVTELPPIEAGQLRCQLCGQGIEPKARFCDACGEGGQLILSALRMRERAARGVTTAKRVFAPRRCLFVVDQAGTKCHEWYTPTGSRAEFCDPHRAESMRSKWRGEQKAKREREHLPEGAT